MRNWQARHRGQNSRTSGALDVFAGAPRLSVTVPPSIEVLWSKWAGTCCSRYGARCPSELIIICAAASKHTTLVSYQEAATRALTKVIGRIKRKTSRLCKRIHPRPPARPPDSPYISWPTVVPSVFNIFQSSPDYLGRRKTVT